jgi:two-component system sensor histidine kinase CreC
MYVAAPVVDQGKIIGVLSVGKPNSAMAPVIHRSERRILWAGGALLGIALLIGLVVAAWINRSIGTLSRYADSVSNDIPLPLPDPGSSELRKLAQALENMRIRLEGKNYIEHYVHALTHELKSPIAAIRGAAEILPSSHRRRWPRGLSIIFWYKMRVCSCWLKNCSPRRGLKIG